ncbi:hypothetical protein ACFFQF_29925 [Haladaptatus pallidirubidus]|uniref:Roadblock/LAMTOR2 domain-containing protein n=1 Tax=Haladaptatus pallidirubidus TaxID=1008152 RepID=A0AAV3UHL9_9EURY|nr:hypothetical protein [Haladaptatus pallidirubidus]
MTATTRNRPEFDTVQLTIEPKEAQELIEQSLKGLQSSVTEDGILLRSSDGMLVAILHDGSPTDEQRRTELAYRVAPPSELATRRGKKIFETLESHRV